MKTLLSDMDDMDVAGAMLLIQQKQHGGGANDKQIPAQSGIGGSKRKNDGTTLLTQPCAPNEAEKEKKIATPKKLKTTVTSSTIDFNYDDTNWIMHEVFDVQHDNVPLYPVRSPAKSAIKVRSDSAAKPKTKRKIIVCGGLGTAHKGKGKRRKGNNRVFRANVGTGAAAQLQSDVAPLSTPGAEQYQLEIESLRRQIAEQTAKLKEVVKLKKKAVSLNRRQARRLHCATPAQQSLCSNTMYEQQRDGASLSHSDNESKAPSGIIAFSHHLQKLSADTAVSQT